MSASATELPRVSVPDVRQELCPSWCTGLALVFAALVVEQLLDHLHPSRFVAASASAVVSVAALGLRFVVKREHVSRELMIPLASLLGLLGVASELIHTSIVLSPREVAHLALALVLCGVGLIPQLALAGIAVLATGCVAALGAGEPAGSGWTDAIAGIAAASIVSLLSNGLVHGLANRLGTLRQQDAEHADRLAHALAAVHLHEARLRQLFDAAHEGMVVHRHGAIVEVNAAAAAILGRARERLAAAPLSSLLEADGAEERSTLEMLARPDAAWEGNALRPDGTRVPVEVKASIITLDGEQVSLTALRDISDRARAESALRTRLAVDELVRVVSSDFLATPESQVDAAVERTLRRVAEFLGADRAHLAGFLPSGNMVCTHEWRAGDVPSLRGRTIDPADPAGRWWVQHMHRGETIAIRDVGDLPPQAGASREWLRGQGLRSLVAVPVHHDGQARGSLSVASTGDLQHPGDTAASMLRIVGELTVGALDRAFSRRRLAASEARKAAILESALDCIVSMDAAGRVIEFNPAAEATFGWKREEVMGREMAELLVPPDQRDAHRAGLVRYLQDGTGPVIGTRIEVAAQRRGGEIFPVELAVVATPADGEPVFTAYLRDITQRKHVEKLRDELVATVSHELRTPLTSLRGFAELLLKRDFPLDRQRKFLSVIHNETIRLMKLVNDFLDLKRLESGEQKVRAEKFDITELLHETVTLFRRDDGPHVFTLALDDALSSVRADPDRTRQVLANLVSNAVKFSPAGGTITLGTRREGDAVVIFVRDEGIGMSEEAMQGLFRKFYRVDNAETRSIGGTGLGLALVKEMVEAQGGRVSVESAPGRGSTFLLTLPAADGDPLAAGAPPRSFSVTFPAAAPAQHDDAPKETDDDADLASPVEPA